MSRLLRGCLALCGVIVIPALIAATAFLPPAAPQTLPKRPAVELSPIDAPSESKAVEMFAAMDRGDLAVRLLPEKNQQARLELENRTDRPLTVEVPKAFGSRFILAGVGIGGAAGTPQRLGGSIRGAGGGFFCIPPEKVGWIRINTACLDESEPEPSLGMVYEVCHLEELSARPEVCRLCAMLGDRRTDARAVQAAVWHLNCDLTWRRLAARLRTLGGPHGSRCFFNRKQIEEGQRLAEVALR